MAAISLAGKALLLPVDEIFNSVELQQYWYVQLHVGVGLQRLLTKVSSLETQTNARSINNRILKSSKQAYYITASRFHTSFRVHFMRKTMIISRHDNSLIMNFKVR